MLVGVNSAQMLEPRQKVAYVGMVAQGWVETGPWQPVIVLQYYTVIVSVLGADSRQMLDR